ncbi:ATP-dependent nuclease [Staphylococcus delphini]|uniref:ATP-dependent nuclease n=1 Tax=Staphylococcus delphini TaxID=53344 RepID=UPI0023B306A5|nr:AAA family ATPase [Staphylococcus delphini]MDE9753470.1 AAA family ATPase [Staphylococcus delphini]MDE9790590.1 AAA family ATPase [Staphylococcus delphini]MDE9791794.1 AAA family ATPase [Staphylococcus delphini]MDE9795461.1 AAA family ATPase [Staphylococcus delphini]MDE9797629.1 AAA family ATPase [Staphylococcus delphini]
MLISRAFIKGYRNLKEVDLELNRLVILIGENNSGKSNILKAMTLPFLNNEIGSINKNLRWDDINNELKEGYFEFIKSNIEQIVNNQIETSDFQEVVPSVLVRVTFTPTGSDEFFVRKWNNSLDDSEGLYQIEYRYIIENTKHLLEHVKSILNGKSKEDIDKIKLNLLPIEMYKYSVVIPKTNEQVAFNDLSSFKYDSLAAERDDFSQKNTQLGSQALVSLLHNKLGNEQKIKVEASYGRFFEDLKEISNLEGIFNWQESSDLENAQEFFEQICLLPNMPSISSLLNNVKLGIGDEYLHSQGLGYRNLIYLLVMMNSLEVNEEAALNILTVEEPEAHLCISNERLLTSFINSNINSTNQIQVFISTHSSEFLNKLELKNVTVVKEGKAFSLSSVVDETELDYLAKKPNLDFLKFLYSRKCILVEGPSEEMLIKSYLAYQKNSLNDIEVISLHKGFKNMLNIWIRVNKDTSHRIGVIRDFDNQANAQQEHEEYNNYENILVTTTSEYTLEPEFVNTGSNYEILKNYFSEEHGWKDSDINTPQELSNKWRTAKTDIMLKFCQDFGSGNLENIELPKHIDDVLKFLKSGVKP